MLLLHILCTVLSFQTWLPVSTSCDYAVWIFAMRQFQTPFLCSVLSRMLKVSFTSNTFFGIKFLSTSSCCVKGTLHSFCNPHKTAQWAFSFHSTRVLCCSIILPKSFVPMLQWWNHSFGFYYTKGNPTHCMGVVSGGFLLICQVLCSSWFGG